MSCPTCISRTYVDCGIRFLIVIKLYLISQNNIETWKMNDVKMVYSYVKNERSSGQIKEAESCIAVSMTQRKLQLTI